MKFHYPMQNLLNIKEKMEEQKKMALGQAQAILAQEIKQLQHMCSRQESSRRTLVDTMNKKVNAKTLQSLYQALKYFEINIKEQENHVTLARNNVENKREQVKQAMIERKTQEKLKDRAYLEFVKQEAIKEQKKVDEIISFKYSL